MTLHTNLETKALRSAFVEAMSRVAATVNIVTTEGEGGPVGATISAMCSVSADGPSPKLLVCLNSGGRLAASVLRNGVFCVNVLASNQASLSDCFAGRRRIPQTKMFETGAWRAMDNGTPGHKEAVARMSCRVTDNRKAGTHFVVFGDVEEVWISNKFSPLVYVQRGYAVTKPLHEYQKWGPTLSKRHPG